MKRSEILDKTSYVLWILTLFLYVGCYTTSLDTLQSLMNEEGLRRYSAERIDEFSIKLHEKLDQQRIRNPLFAPLKVEDTFHNIPIVLKSEPITINAHILDDSIISWCCSNLDETHFIAATSHGTLVFMDSAFSSVFNFHTNVSIHEMQAFKHNNRLWLVCLHKNSLNEYYLQVYEYHTDYKVIDQRQNLKLIGESFFYLITIHNSVFISFASSDGQNSILSLYEWKNTMFDEISTLTLKSKCSSLTMWNIDKSIYIATTFPTENFSSVVRYNPIEETRLIQMEQIEITFPLTVNAFKVSGSLYLIYEAVGKAIIFWWNGAHFIQWQKIVISSEHKAIVGISTLTLLDKVILAIGEYDKVQYYFQDESSNYIRIGVTHLPENTRLKKIRLKKQKESYYLLPVFETENFPSFVYELNIASQALSSQISQDGLSSCLNDVSRLLERNQKAIDKVLSSKDNIWMINKNTSVLPIVNINGSIITDRHININIIKITNETISDALSSDINNFVDTLYDKVFSLTSNIASTVSKTTNETLKANLSFSGIVSASIGNIGKLLTSVLINNIMITLPLPFLILYGEQIIKYQSTFHNIVTEMATIHGTLNGKKLEDLALLKGTEILIGNITMTDTEANDLFVKSYSLNGVNTNNLVINSHNQEIEGQKRFETLSAYGLNSDGHVNNINTQEILNVMLVNDGYFEGDFDFNSDLYVTGNLETNEFVGSINLDELADKSVKVHGIEEIKGIKNFLNPLVIENNLKSSSFNSIDFDRILTLTTSQDITGHFNLLVKSSFHKDIFASLINNIEFANEVVTQHETNYVKGDILFTQSLNAFEIKMKDENLIDSFDPSKEKLSVLTVSNTVFDEATTLTRISITDDLNISNSNPGFPLLNVLENVWMRSKPQEIPFFKFKNIDLNDLEVNTVNNLSIENDFITLSEDSEVSSVKLFNSNINVHNIELDSGITLNKIDISSLKDMLLDDRRIFDIITIKGVLVEGDVKVTGLINSLNVSDIMLTTLKQTCEGKRIFEFATINDLDATNLFFDFYNSINFTLFVNSAILSIPHNVVMNKWFQSLRGIDISIHGNVNGKVFEDMLNQVVTVDTFQKVQLKVFVDSLNADTILARLLSGFDISDFINNLVLTDERQKGITGKSFQKVIWTNTLSIEGVIDDIDVTHLQKSSISKRGNNYINYPITFIEDLMIEHVYVKNATIDGVDLQFLITLSESFDSAYMNFQDIRVRNIQINGLINECDLKWTVENAVQVQKDEQSISGLKAFSSLKVIGNLSVKCTLNGISLEYLNRSVIPLSGTSSMSGNYVFKNISIIGLTVLQLTNELDIMRLVDDAVTHEDFQVMKGRKRFKDLLLEKVFIDSLYVNKSLCDVDLSSLFDFSVLKNTVQKLPAHIFHHIISNNVVLKGKLNDVKVPKELVLVDTHETIYSDTVINSTLDVESDLHVFGKIDNVQLLHFLNERVTIFGKEKIIAPLTFLQDAVFENESTIRGHVNNLRINKIVNTFGDQTLAGLKNFALDLVTNDIYVQNEVNFYNLAELNKNIVKYNKDEDVFSIVSFNDISTSSLFVSGNIGNISLFELWDDMHDKHYKVSKLFNSLPKKIGSYDDYLQDFKYAREYLASSFGYFEHHQFLNITYSKRFFPVYEPPTIGDEHGLVSDMIIWIRDDEGCMIDPNCCNDIVSHEMSILNDGSLRHSDQMVGKIFQYNLKLQQEDVVGFVIRVYQRCSDNVPVIDLETMHYEGSKTLNTLLSPPNSTMLDTRLLEIDEEIFLIVAYNFKGPGEKLFIYRYEVLLDKWPIHQKYYPWNPTSIDTVVVKDEDIEATYLAVTGYSSTPGLTLYVWLNNEHTLSFIQSVSTSIPGTAKWINHGSELFLLLAKEKSKEQKENSWVDVYTEPIEVYSFSQVMELNHTINIRGIHMLESFKFSDETYVLAASRHLQTIYVIQWRGYNGFEVIQELPAPGVESVTVFTSPSNDLMLAIASTTGHTKILKSAFRGSVKYLD